MVCSSNRVRKSLAFYLFRSCYNPPSVTSLVSVIEARLCRFPLVSSKARFSVNAADSVSVRHGGRMSKIPWILIFGVLLIKKCFSLSRSY